MPRSWTALRGWHCRHPWSGDVIGERNKAWKKRFLAEKVCAEPAFAAEKRLDGNRFAVPSIGRTTKMEKNQHALDTGGRDVKIGNFLGLVVSRLNPNGKSRVEKLRVPFLRPFKFVFGCCESGNLRGGFLQLKIFGIEHPGKIFFFDGDD